MNWLAVAVGGAAGSVMRYAVGLAFVRTPAAFPMSTLIVNVTGSFLIGVLARAFDSNSAESVWRLALVVGFCGGFTTFSTFSADIVSLLHEGRLARVALYASASVLLSLAATLAGFGVGGRLITIVRTFLAA